MCADEKHVRVSASPVCDSIRDDLNMGLEGLKFAKAANAFLTMSLNTTTARCVWLKGLWREGGEGREGREGGKGGTRGR